MTSEDRRLFSYLPVILRLMGRKHRQKLFLVGLHPSLFADWPPGRLVFGGESLFDKLVRAEELYCELYEKMPPDCQHDLNQLFLTFSRYDMPDLDEQKETWKTIFEILDRTPAQIVRMT